MRSMDEKLTKDNYLKINDDLSGAYRGKVICPDDLTFKGQSCKSCKYHDGMMQILNQRYVICMYASRDTKAES